MPNGFEVRRRSQDSARSTMSKEERRTRRAMCLSGMNGSEIAALVAVARHTDQSTGGIRTGEMNLTPAEAPHDPGPSDER